MTISQRLGAEEKDIVARALELAEQENISPSWEFPTIFGIERRELSNVRRRWPEVNMEDPTVQAATIGALSQLLGYPHGQPDVLNHLQAKASEVRAIVTKLRAIASGR